MPKKYIHNKPGVGPNKVPPSWLDRDEDKVPACAMPNWHAGVYAARLRRSWTFCLKSALSALCRKTSPSTGSGPKPRASLAAGGCCATAPAMHSAAAVITHARLLFLCA